MDRRHLIQAFSLVSATWLAGCAKPPPPPPKPRELPIELVAAANVNPDIHERASPLTLRLYGLKNASAFSAADFFSLYEKETATLGADVLLREEMVLRPGESKKLVWTLPGDLKFVGVMAAFRDLERAQWRDVHTLSPAPGLRVLLNGRRASIQAVNA